MPKGELYLRTSKVTAAFSKEDECRMGLVTDTENPFHGYADAFVRYGLSLEDGAIDRILTPSPHKQPVGSGNAITDGVAYIGASVGVTDERELSFDVHLSAPHYREYLRRYKLFCDEILAHDRSECVWLRTGWFPSVAYRLIYNGIEQFSGFTLGLAKFTLSFTEPHPELRI